MLLMKEIGTLSENNKKIEKVKELRMLRMQYY